MKTKILAFLTFVLSACSTVSTLTEKPVITLEEFNQLQNGMTIEQSETRLAHLKTY
ncbi:hypothetical protein Cha6605_3481 [Chamaesiphon minutus PCC 6605]|uniref:Lipoprotein n=1 Tax=Chamaesiphon minutus (strain ATCC 27169 / PCC 6605) TaxID=1173020 RepID=K9UH88_CHAP6|nr:hypothetical protein Cha6605_3481 [Chamaesiphon minutus PCC 6605]